MKYSLMAKAMWGMFKNGFEKQLTNTLSESEPKMVMKNAKKKYKEIILSIDEFEKGDRFIINILSCAMLSSILLSVSKKYDVEDIRVYYRKAMCENKLMKKFAKKSKSYTVKGRNKLKRQAEESMNNNNPYSWKFSVKDGKTINQYTATFYTCGICYLMKKLNIAEYISAMCSLDYDMAELNNTSFTRKYTLASGGPYCDCNYDHH